MLRFVSLVFMFLTTMIWISPANASCAKMRRLAQEAANDMARRDHMDHNWFYSHRRGSGVDGAENAGEYYKTKAQMIAVWWGSPGHAANMRLNYACKSVASASNGRHIYWAMEIGHSDQEMANEKRDHSNQRKKRTAFSWGM